MPRKICIDVVGSLNIDLVTRISRIPNAGETLAATSFDTGFGGKGANQAVACSRLLRRKADDVSIHDVHVNMVGALGDDQFGTDFKVHLTKERIGSHAVLCKEGKKTGTAVIIVEEGTGDNRILFSAGANRELKPEDLPNEKSRGDVVLVQLEIPLPTVLACLRRAKRHQKEVILNPAPAVPLPEEAYHELDNLILNETEASLLSGIPVDQPSDRKALDEAAAIFIQRGVRRVIITLGSKGVYYQTFRQAQADASGRMIPARKVPVVDTTAAGDTFVGAYAAVLAHYPDLNDANLAVCIEFANCAASMTVQKEGAQSSMPFLDEVPSENHEAVMELFFGE